MRRSRLIPFLLALVLGACGGGGGGPPISGCSLAEQNQFVFDLMNDVYYWIDDVPAVSIDGLATPEEVFEAFRFQPLDRFSVIADLEAHEALISDSQFIGYGIGLKLVDFDRVRITQVFGGSPAAAAGLARGDEITALDGRAVGDILAAEGSLDDAFGADALGVATTIDYLDGGGIARQVTLEKAWITIETVSLATTFEDTGQSVGYLVFRNFVEPSFAALDTAFAAFEATGVTALVLDLRYNGGGLISVAQYLAGLVGGTRTAGEVFARRVHNARNASLNETQRFSDEPHALDLAQVVIIASPATASASELVINALRPFIAVTLVGDTTFGKPVGAYAYPFCDKVALPTAFTNLNALNEGDFFAGFAPDCAAADDLDRPLGDPAEASLAEALHVVEHGQCSTPPVAMSPRTLGGRRLDAGAHAASANGWRQLVNAY
jgi:C-terminal processing protease CtpA/Prc